MSAKRRLRLRVLDELRRPESATDALRSQLGGRAAVSDESVGELVVVRGRLPPAPAVVLFADAAEAHVWIGEGLVRRVVRANLERHRGEPSQEHAAVAESARLFATLIEGARAIFLDRSGTAKTGVLVEKHRFGALVAVGGQVVAVGFRRFLSPATPLA